MVQSGNFQITLDFYNLQCGGHADKGFTYHQERLTLPSISYSTDDGHWHEHPAADSKPVKIQRDLR